MSLIDSIEWRELGDVGHFNTLWITVAGHLTRLTTGPTFDDRLNLALIPLVRNRIRGSFKKRFDRRVTEEIVVNVSNRMLSFSNLENLDDSILRNWLEEGDISRGG
ncbi:hypothetical protein Acr_15g0011970 [Actinidia rufa]|uniref:Uncharacterized protein n=1 Tax=Actinidia rufa TaxID=165716 RepID=A0A7J0FV55_9ERIC|nr:hypothetical protein Acr_15g0011970 [Actinidia rufa]